MRLEAGLAAANAAGSGREGAVMTYCARTSARAACVRPVVCISSQGAPRDTIVWWIRLDHGSARRRRRANPQGALSSRPAEPAIFASQGPHT